MTTARDAIELARETLSETLWDRLCCDPDDEPIGREAILARALLAEHERAERLEAGLREALAIAWRRGRGEFPPDDSDTLAMLWKLLPVVVVTAETAERVVDRLASPREPNEALRKLLQEKP